MFEQWNSLCCTDGACCCQGEAFTGAVLLMHQNLGLRCSCSCSSSCCGWRQRVSRPSGARQQSTFGDFLKKIKSEAEK